MARMINASDVRVDRPVFTVDGKHLGFVKEVERDAFKIDAPWQRDYWVSCDVVMSAGERVTLDVTGEDVDDIKRNEPSRDVPREYRARGYDETWRGPGPDYLSAGRRWETSRDQPELNYGSWQRERRGEYGEPNRGFDEPRESFYGDSHPSGRRYYSDSPQFEPYPSAGPYEIDYTRSSRFEGREDYRGSRGLDDGRGERAVRSDPYTGLPDDRSWEGSMAYDSEAPYGYYGRGPRSYRRPDESICDEVCERLTRHGEIDASDVDVSVRNGEVILEGKVDDRYQRRIAEDVATSISGVRDVNNSIKVAASSRSERGGEIIV